MSRAPTPQTNEYPFHLAARSNNRDWFSIPMRLCWQIFLRNLWGVHDRYGFTTHAFVLMNNHYHWLVSTPQSNLGEGMCWFQTRTSWSLARSACRVNKIYGGRYKPTLLLEPEHFANSVRYVYQNPLRAGIADKARNYPWSTLNRDQSIVRPCLGFDSMIPLKKDFNSWIETVPQAQVNQAIRSALRRRSYKYPVDRKTRKPMNENSWL